jgi:hypothetical protein
MGSVGRGDERKASGRKRSFANGCSQPRLCENPQTNSKSSLFRELWKRSAAQQFQDSWSKVIFSLFLIIQITAGVFTQTGTEAEVHKPNIVINLAIVHMPLARRGLTCDIL